MASSSTSSNQKSFKYHVFLSFRGEDTCKTFVDHLYSSLTRQGIHTFRDNEELEKGKRIDELFKAIEESRFFIIVFSKNYASSSWCLKEVTKIMECHDGKEQIAYPLFYDVEPSDIRKQSGPVGRAIAKHKSNEQIKKWEKALKGAGNLVGWDLKKIANGHEAEAIKTIVEEISLKLRSIRLSNDENLMGMDRRMQELESSLGIGLNDEVRMIGIKGMGGIGKTTLAKAIYDKVSSHFEGSAFIEGVREQEGREISKREGLRSLQERVLSVYLNDEHMRVGSVHDGKRIMRMRLPYKKVLLVLDDVDRIDQLEALAGDWFKDGSRIIITTRDEKVLLAHGVNANWIHNVSLLLDEEAMSLFSRYAFKRYIPDEGYEKLSSEVVRYAAGLPLTIRVLGSHLRGEKEDVWRDALKRLETIPLRETLEVLEISYNSLEDDHKEMFLDVACFFKGFPKDDVIRVLDSLGFRTAYGLRILRKKSLITISNNGRLGMHDRIEELGKHIVRQSHPQEPNKHSRLWIREEIDELFSDDDVGTEVSTCIGLQLVGTEPSPEIIIKRLGNLNKLRYLCLWGKLNDCFPSDWKFDQAKQYFPNSLQFLSWESYPGLSLPQTFLANNLVGLHLHGSRIVQLWESGERKVLKKLRFLNLSNSNLRTLDLRMTPHLEKLELYRCHHLTEIHAPAGCLEKLVHVELRGCRWSVSFWLSKQLESRVLLKLYVSVECLEELPRDSTNNLPMLQFKFQYLKNVGVVLDLQPCTKLKSVSGSICGFQHLRHLTFYGCIPEMPNDLDQLKCLEQLVLLSAHIKCLPDSICMLKHLKTLTLFNCQKFEELPENLGWLENLEELRLSATSIRRLPDSICKLKHLKSLQLDYCGLLEKLPKDIGQLECLETLNLKECASLGDIPNSICNMKCLIYFYLCFCPQVQKLPEDFGNIKLLKVLDIRKTGISHLPHSISSLNGLCIAGSKSLLQSCAAFATEIQTSKEFGAFCYIEAMNSTPPPTELRSQSTENNLKSVIHQSSIPLVASSSASSIHKSFKYDVFLSFRGKDTSDIFVRHLNAAFQRQGTHTYMDNGRMELEIKIDDEIIRSIEGSKFIIIVFSKNYVSSSMCLDELVKIMECHKTTEHTAYPVFYDVEPSEVRDQIGAVGDDTGIWRQALKEAADMAGWDMRDYGNETEFIEQIAEDIWLNLSSINVYINNKIIGMDPQIDEVLSSVGPGVGDVRMIGITGMRGIGKTTLARAIFDRVSSDFEGGRSFVKNVREYAKPSLSGLKSLQEQVLSDVLAKKDITISSVSEGKSMIQMELGYRKVLVVLDDVDRIEQLEALAGARSWFGNGSMIIITTRNLKMLIEHGVDQIHHVRRLPEKEALCLFCLYAFWGDKPVEGYEHLSLEVVRCVAGHPLEIKVLGSLLRGKSMSEWIDWLQTRISSEQTLEILEQSYISLEGDNKEIFLDIACFMKRLRENDAIRILESCGFSARDGLRVLVRKSLLTISDDQDHHRLDMLDPIEEMGRNIVRRVDPDQPRQHSRLWIRNEIENILANQQGTEETRRIQLSETQLSSKIVMEGVGRMEALRCLVVESENDNEDFSCDWNFDVDRQYLPDALRFLRWVHYPVPSLPITFQADNLVALELPKSKITQLWEGGERQVLNNLRFLDLSHSTLTILDLKLTPRLEWLELKECRDLEDLITPDGSLTRLVHLDLIGCSSIDSFSIIKRLESLELLSLSKLDLTATAKRRKETLKRSSDLPLLEFTCSYSEEVPSSSRYGLKFVSLNLKHSKKLERLSGNIAGLQHLRHLTLNGDIPEVPNDLHLLPSLEKLGLFLTKIKCLPDSICMLNRLKSLKLKSCSLLERLPEGLGQLEGLEKLTLLSTCINRLPDSICMLKRLKSLKLKSCVLLAEVPENLGDLECLEKLNLLSARIKRLPDSICMLECLKSLELQSCKSLERLPENLGKLKCLEKLILAECASLNEIPNSICNMKNLKWFSLRFCDKVKNLPEQLGQLECLRELNVIGTGVTHIPLSISFVEDLRIVGSVTVLNSCGFAPEIQNLEGETFCYTPAKITTITGAHRRISLIRRAFEMLHKLKEKIHI